MMRVRINWVRGRGRALNVSVGGFWLCEQRLRQWLVRDVGTAVAGAKRGHGGGCVREEGLGFLRRK